MTLPHPQQILDVFQTADDLDVAARFWLRLYRKGNEWRTIPRNERCSIEIRVSGFPRSQGPSLLDELTHRLRDSELYEPVVELVDPNTLVVTTRPRADQTPPTGLGLIHFTGRPFDRLVIEIRFQVIGGDRLTFLSGPAMTSLVMVGELRDNGIRVRGVFWSPLPAKEDAYFRNMAELEPGPLVKGLQHFRKTGQVEASLASAVFGKFEGLGRRMRFESKVLNVPFGRPRLLGLIGRIALFTLVLTLAGFGILYAIETRTWYWLLPAGLALLSFGKLFVLFIRHECKLLFGLFHTQRQGLDFTYVVPARYARVPSSRSIVLDEDPMVRKFTTELKAEGFSQIADVAHVTFLETGTVFRLFQAPDAVTSLVLICEALPSWPRMIFFEAQTFLTCGGRVDSVSHPHGLYGYMKAESRSDVQICVFPGVADPVEFYHLHNAALDSFIAEKGYFPVPHERLEDNLRRQEIISEDECQYYQHHPYSWADHLRWYLQIPRTEQRS